MEMIINFRSDRGGAGSRFKISLLAAQVTFTYKFIWRYKA